VNRLIRRANQRISLGGAAALLIVTALLGQVLGFLRTKLVNANFEPIGPQGTDAYFAAFKITLAAGALGVAFIPILADHMERSDRKGVWELSSSLLNLLSIVMAVVGCIIILFAEPLLHYVVAPTLSPEQLHNAATIMRLIAFNPLLFTISGILTSVQQTYGRFFFFAIAPLIYNLSIIASIFLFRHNLGLIGLGVGALIGALLQVGVSIMGIWGLGFQYWAKIKWKSADFRLILRQLPARSIDQGIDSINSIVETNFAKRLGDGFLSYYENAYTLHTAPTLLIGTAISTAAFPRLTERMSQGRPDLFRKEFLQILRGMIWIAVPVVLVSYFARAYLARLIFTRNSPEIAVIFGFLAGAIFFRILYAIISRYFYAQKDTKTPLFVSLFAIGLNIFLAYTLSRPWSYGVSGLALAQSIVAATEVFVLVVIMLIRDHRIFDLNFLRGIVKIISVTGFSIIAAFIMISLLPLQITDTGIVALGGKLGMISVVTLAVHIGMSWLFGLDEVRPVLSKLYAFILKPVRIKW
jgi:putative peptidoglycan lipid II flippase